MEYIYAVAHEGELAEYRRFTARTEGRLAGYLEFLKARYRVSELPRAIVWASRETATRLFSDLPVPAYTNEYRVVFCPVLAAWQDIYLRQLDGMEGCGALERYYRERLSENHVLQILGHELAHHSDHFPDEWDGERGGVWFEEGMAEYISRSYFLTGQEYAEALEQNRALVKLLGPRYGAGSLEDFGEGTYQEGYAGIFFAYWRSFLAVHRLVEEAGGDTGQVFASYRRWQKAGPGTALAQWFGLE